MAPVARRLFGLVCFDCQLAHLVLTANAGVAEQVPGSLADGIVQSCIAGGGSRVPERSTRPYSVESGPVGVTVAAATVRTGHTARERRPVEALCFRPRRVGPLRADRAATIQRIVVHVGVSLVTFGPTSSRLS